MEAPSPSDRNIRWRSSLPAMSEITRLQRCHRWDQRSCGLRRDLLCSCGLGRRPPGRHGGTPHQWCLTGRAPSTARSPIAVAGHILTRTDLLRTGSHIARHDLHPLGVADINQRRAEATLDVFRTPRPDFKDLMWRGHTSRISGEDGWWPRRRRGPHRRREGSTLLLPGMPEALRVGASRRRLVWAVTLDRGVGERHVPLGDACACPAAETWMGWRRSMFAGVDTHKDPLPWP